MAIKPVQYNPKKIMRPKFNDKSMWSTPKRDGNYLAESFKILDEYMKFCVYFTGILSGLKTMWVSSKTYQGRPEQGLIITADTHAIHFVQFFVGPKTHKF